MRRLTRAIKNIWRMRKIRMKLEYASEKDKDEENEEEEKEENNNEEKYDEEEYQEVMKKEISGGYEEVWKEEI